MDLDFSEEQQLIADTARALLQEHAPLNTVRIWEDDPKGFPDALWKQLAETGLLGMRIPEQFGGGGMNLLDETLVHEEWGRALAPGPFFCSSVLGAGALMAAGSEAQQQQWLPRIADGSAIITPAWFEPERGQGEAGVQLKAQQQGQGENAMYVLNGAKHAVSYAAAAQQLLVLARAEAGVELFLVDPQAEGVQLHFAKSQGREPYARVEFRNVQAPESARLNSLQKRGAGWQTWCNVMQQGIVLLAAQAVGGADRCLWETVEYAKERVQFNKPLGAFQALAHYLADASTNIDGGRVLVHEAAWNHSKGRGIGRLAPMAKLFCCEAYRETTRVCAQIWGGVAFTLEYDVQMFFRRAKHLQLSWWDTPYLEELIAADVLDGGAEAAQ